jgi:hypothetical protein
MRARKAKWPSVGVRRGITHLGLHPELSRFAHPTDLAPRARRLGTQPSDRLSAHPLGTRAWRISASAGSPPPEEIAVIRGRGRRDLSHRSSAAETPAAESFKKKIGRNPIFFLHSPKNTL